MPTAQPNPSNRNAGASLQQGMSRFAVKDAKPASPPRPRFMPVNINLDDDDDDDEVKPKIEPLPDSASSSSEGKLVGSTAQGNGWSLHGYGGGV